MHPTFFVLWPPWALPPLCMCPKQPHAHSGGDEASAGTGGGGGRHGHRLLLKDPGGGAPWPAPGDAPTHPHEKIFLRYKMKFIKGARNLRRISGTQNFFGL